MVLRKPNGQYFGVDHLGQLFPITSVPKPVKISVESVGYYISL